MSETVDVVVVGGGIAGSALAGRLAEAGLEVLFLERQATYRDRGTDASDIPELAGKPLNLPHS